MDFTTVSSFEGQTQMTPELSQVLGEVQKLPTNQSNSHTSNNSLWINTPSTSDLLSPFVQMKGQLGMQLAAGIHYKLHMHGVLIGIFKISLTKLIIVSKHLCFIHMIFRPTSAEPRTI
jgi:hypothetical protein